jgi:hypothetical protein
MIDTLIKIIFVHHLPDKIIFCFRVSEGKNSSEVFSLHDHTINLKILCLLVSFRMHILTFNMLQRFDGEIATAKQK